MTHHGADEPPELSVIIACHNAAATLGTQLEALTRQSTDRAWEVLVCDNRSTDSSREVAEHFRPRLPLRIVTADESPGAGYARNVGVAAGSGRWVAFVDADDEVDDGWLAAILDGLDHHEFVAGSFDGERLNTRWVARTRHLEQRDGLQSSPFGPSLPHAAAANMAVTRAAFEAVGGFDTGLAALEDTDLCWRLQQAGTALTFWPAAVVHMRLRSSWRSMYQQGRAYGTGARELAHRYADAGEPSADGAGGATTPVLPRIVTLLRAAHTPGALLWQLGWHRGWRRGAPASAGH